MQHKMPQSLAAVAELEQPRWEGFTRGLDASSPPRAPAALGRESSPVLVPNREQRASVLWLCRPEERTGAPLRELPWWFLPGPSLFWKAHWFCLIVVFRGPGAWRVFLLALQGSVALAAVWIRVTFAPCVLRCLLA